MVKGVCVDEPEDVYVSVNRGVSVEEPEDETVAVERNVSDEVPEDETVTVTLDDAEAESDVAAVKVEDTVEKGDIVKDVEAVAVVVVVAVPEGDPVDDGVTLDEAQKVATAVCADD